MILINRMVTSGGVKTQMLTPIESPGTQLQNRER